jgi:rhamnosyl/mannosyltransferase
MMYGVRAGVFALAKRPDPAQLDVAEGTLHRAKQIFEIASCDIGGLSSFRLFKKLASEADLIHYHYPWPFADVLNLLVARGKPYVVTYHSDVVRQRFLDLLYAPLRASFLRGAAAIVATSPAYRKSSPFLRDMPGDVREIPLCLASGFNFPDEQRRADFWREKLGIGYFLFVGVLRYYKGLDFLIEAAKLTGIPVVIAGEGPEGERLRGLARSVGNVKFIGRIDDKDKALLLGDCRAIVFPSHLRSEAFGMTLLEGAAKKKPLISTEIGTGTSYVNQNNITGFVVPPGDAGALSEAMKTLFADEVLANRMGEAAFQRYCALFSSSVVGKRYFDLYCEILGRGPDLENGRDEDDGVRGDVAEDAIRHPEIN